MLASKAVRCWIEQRRAEGYSPCTLRAYRLQLGLLLQAIGDVQVASITLDHLRGYIAGPKSANRKASTIAHRVRMIRSFFYWCVEEELLLRSPALKLKEPKLPARLPKAMPFEDLELIRDACQTTREHALIEFRFATGCRSGEVSGIHRQDVDWERHSVQVLGKGFKEREVYFGARAALWLRRYLRNRVDECPYLFATERGPVRQLQRHQIWWLVKSVADRVGLRDRVWQHAFRHTLGTVLLNQGAPLVAVQSILGHDKPKTTQIHARLSGANRQQAYAKYFIQ